MIAGVIMLQMIAVAFFSFARSEYRDGIDFAMACFRGVFWPGYVLLRFYDVIADRRR